jgi:hypothetical protein
MFLQSGLPTSLTQNQRTAVPSLPKLFHDILDQEEDRMRLSKAKRLYVSVVVAQGSVKKLGQDLVRLWDGEAGTKSEGKRWLAKSG